MVVVVVEVWGGGDQSGVLMIYESAGAGGALVIDVSANPLSL